MFFEKREMWPLLHAQNMKTIAVFCTSSQPIDRKSMIENEKRLKDQHMNSPYCLVKEVLS
jgi:hypothetical protein